MRLIISSKSAWLDAAHEIPQSKSRCILKMEQKSTINWQLHAVFRIVKRHLSGCWFNLYCLSAVGNFVVHDYDCKSLNSNQPEYEEVAEIKMYIGAFIQKNVRTIARES